MNLEEIAYYDLVALARALHEARFPKKYNDPAVWGAPFVIQLHCDVWDEVWRRDGITDPLADEKIGAWLQWKGRDEHTTVLNRIQQDVRLSQMILEDEQVIRNRLRPFIVDDESMADFVRVAKETLIAVQEGVSDVT